MKIILIGLILGNEITNCWFNAGGIVVKPFDEYFLRRHGYGYKPNFNNSPTAKAIGFHFKNKEAAQTSEAASLQKSGKIY